MAFVKRFPKWDEIIPVLAVGVTILFSWSIIASAKDLINNWGLYFGVADLLSLFAYVIAGAFLESLLVMAALLIISLILPKKIFAGKFVLRGTILTITFLGSIIYLYSKTLTYGIYGNLNKWGEFFAVSTLIFFVFGEFFPAVSKVIEFIADRCIIFLYIYLPLSFISIIAVVLRNVT